MAVTPGRGTLVLGVFGRPHGVRGEIVFHAFNPGGVAWPSSRCPCRSSCSAARETAAAILLAARPFKDGALVRLEGVATREAAAALTDSSCACRAPRCRRWRTASTTPSICMGCAVFDSEGRGARARVTGILLERHPGRADRRRRGRAGAAGPGGRRVPRRGRPSAAAPGDRLHDDQHERDATSARAPALRGGHALPRAVRLVPGRQPAGQGDRDRGLVAVTRTNPRDCGLGRHRSVDDSPYGGGPGMVLRPEPLAAAIDDSRGGARTDPPGAAVAAGASVHPGRRGGAGRRDRASC